MYAENKGLEMMVVGFKERNRSGHQVPAVWMSRLLYKVVCSHCEGRPQAMASLMCSVWCKVVGELGHRLLQGEMEMQGGRKSRESERGGEGKVKWGSINGHTAKRICLLKFSVEVKKIFSMVPQLV